MGLKMKRNPLNQPNTGSPNSPLLILTLTSTGSHPHLFLLPDSSSRTAAASPPLPPHPLPPPSSTSAAAHPCLLRLRRPPRPPPSPPNPASSLAPASSGRGLSVRWRPASARCKTGGGRTGGGARGSDPRRCSSGTAARRGMAKRRGRPGFSTAWMSRRRLENRDCASI